MQVSAHMPARDHRGGALSLSAPAFSHIKGVLCEWPRRPPSALTPGSRRYARTAPMALSRRELVVRGGRLAIASAAGGLWFLDRTLERSAGAAEGGNALRKCISLGGPGSL